MSFYACGHDRKMVFVKKNIAGYAHYLTWLERHGPDGDRDHCWECEVRMTKERERQRDIEHFLRDMRMMTEGAILKALSRRNKKGNVLMPYNESSVEHLEARMMEEFVEYFENPKISEIHDIIATAAFVGLARLNKLAENAPDVDGRL